MFNRYHHLRVMQGEFVDNINILPIRIKICCCCPSVGRLRMTQIIRKSGLARLVITVTILTVIFGFLFDFVAQKSFIANYYVTLRSALLHGTFGMELVPNLVIVLIAGFVFFLIPSFWLPAILFIRKTSFHKS